MSGPALRYIDSHHAIHEAAYGEAEEMTRVLRKVVEAGETTLSVELAYVLVEHWETRTLRHAEAEEDGFYLEVLRGYPQMKVDVLMLKRDHDIMRILVSEIKQLLRETGCPMDVVTRFEALLHVVTIHSREEEKRLCNVLQAEQ